MGLFKKRQKQEGLAVQTAAAENKDLIFGRWNMAAGCENRLYRSLRESVPVIDAAIYKTVRLTSGFRVRCRDEQIQSLLDDFSRNINVDGISTGLDFFISEYLEQLLTYGTAVAEMVLDGNSHLAALYNCPLENVVLESGSNPLDIHISSINAIGEKVPVEYPQLILFSVIHPEPGKLYGTSILHGLPFVSELFMKIMNAVGTNWDRVGNVRFAVTYKPTDADRSFTKERAMQIASEWSKAMKSSEPKDFVSVGDVSIKAIGADNQIPDSQVPVRQILEQITAKLAIPPFLLGLSWSSTERMSSQQADILTTELEYYRRTLESVILRICRCYLSLCGIAAEISVEWDNISLQDEVELAKARLYRARAEEIELRNQKG